MRAFTGLAGLAIAGVLGGCAGGVTMPGLSLSADADDTAGATQQAQAIDPAAVPPLPARNPKKPKVAAAARPQEAAAASAAEPEVTQVSLLAQMNPFSGGVPAVSNTVQADITPTAAYTMLAQQIHACWLTPGAPKLPNHGFHADVSPGDAGSAKVILYEKTADKKRGMQVYKITIEGGETSSISAENHKLDAKLDAAFKLDLARWAKGDTRCKE